MKQKLVRRLVLLEEIKAAADRAKAACAPLSGPSAAEIIRERLRLRGFVPTGNESMAETLGRAFELNSQELRSLIAGPVEAFHAKLQSL